MNRPERFAAQAGADDEARTGSRTFPVEAGGIYALRVLLLGEDRGLIAGAAVLRCEFADADGFVIPPDYDRLLAAAADARSIPVEVYSRRIESAVAAADYAATRLIVAPPRAAAATITLTGGPCELRRIELQRIGLGDLQPGRDGAALVRAFGAMIDRLRAALSESGAGDLPAGVDLRRPLEDQVSALPRPTSEFDWKALRKEGLVPHAMGLVDKRRRLTPKDRVIAFIGSERLYHKLASHAHVVLVREEDAAASLALRPDALVVEACGEAVLGAWRQQLCSADGRLGGAAADLLRRARQLGIPLHVIAPGRRDRLALYRELLNAADRLILEGAGGEELADLLPPGRATAVPRSFERTVAAPVVDLAHPGFRLIVANASSILGNEAHAALIAALDGANLLLAEPFVDLSETQISNLLPFARSVLAGSCRHVELLYYLQHAEAVLLFMDSPALDEELQDLVLDATACGAMVIALGDTARLGPLAPFVTAAEGPNRVLELVGLYGHVHYREQLWLARYRALCRAHGFERVMRILDGGRGRSEAELPLASIITATKRPHLLDQILATYARQSYPNKELIIVFHGAEDTVPEIPPELAGGVRVIRAPAFVNLGFCLNEGIRAAAGDIWFKVDDDDYYGPHYIEDLVNAFAFSGADIVGKPTYLVYLEGVGQTVCRTVREARKRKFYNHRPNKVPRLTGATLSARRGVAGPFSLRRRAGVDSEWTERMANEGKVLFSSDYLNFVVYRGADKAHHTWTMEDERFLSSGTLMGDGLARHMA